MKVVRQECGDECGPEATQIDGPPPGMREAPIGRRRADVGAGVLHLQVRIASLTYSLYLPTPTCIGSP